MVSKQLMSGAVKNSEQGEGYYWSKTKLLTLKHLTKSYFFIIMCRICIPYFHQTVQKTAPRFKSSTWQDKAHRVTLDQPRSFILTYLMVLGEDKMGKTSQEAGEDINERIF